MPRSIKLGEAPSIIPLAMPKAKVQAKSGKVVEHKANLSDTYVEAVGDFNDNEQAKVLIDFNFGKRGEKPSVPGLRARIGKHRVTWIYRHDDRRNKVPLNTRGKRRRITVKRLGFYPDMNVDAAREAAKIWAGKVAEGIPTPGKKEQTKFREAFTEYVAYLKSKAAEEGKEPRWAKNVQQLGNQLMLPEWGDWTLFEMAQDYGRKAMKQWHTRIKERNGPTSANHCARLVRAIYRQAAETDDSLSGDPSKVPTAACRITGEAWQREQKQGKPKPGLPFKQFPEWLAAWRKLPPMRRAYHLTNLLTGARPGELAQTPWTNLDCRARTLTIGNSKIGTDIPIPLSAPIARALKLARDAQRASGEKSELIFPGAARGNRDPLPARGHAMRRTYKTVATDCGVSDELSAFLLGHIPPGLSQKYIVRKMLLEGPMMRRKQREISNRMLALLGSDPTL